MGCTVLEYVRHLQNQALRFHLRDFMNVIKIPWLLVQICTVQNEWCIYNPAMLYAWIQCKQINFKWSRHNYGSAKQDLGGIQEDSKVAKKMVMCFHFVEGWRF